MGKLRRLILAVLVVFIGFCVYHGVTRTQWKSIYVATASIPANTGVTFSCGAPWGANTVKPPANLQNSPIEGTPCGTHTSDRVMLALSVVVGVGGIIGVTAWPRRRDEDDEPGVAEFTA